MVATMNKIILKIVAKDTGISEDKIPFIAFDDIDKIIEEKSGEELDFKNELRYSPRGNYLIQEGYIITNEEIKKKFNEVFKLIKK